MGMTAYAANSRDPFLSTFERNLGEWSVITSYINAKGPPAIVAKIRWRGNGPLCLDADAAAALGKWMQRALVADDPSPLLRQELSEQDAFYALEDLKLFAEFREYSGGFCIT
jgi:hypothetical protein